MTQLGLFLGRTLRLPADEDASFDVERIEFIPVTVDLSPRQAAWMGTGDPAATCPGCVLFEGGCALHDTAA